MTAGLVALIAALSPFDLALPPDGWTALYLRPLLLVTAVAAALAAFAGRRVVDRWAVGAVALLVAGVAVAAAASPSPSVGWAVVVRVAVLGLVFLAATAAGSTGSGRRLVMSGLALGLVLAGVVGLAVLIAGGDRWGTGYLLGSISETRGVVRLTRPFSHANVAAFFLAPAVVAVAVEAGAATGRTRRSSLAIAGMIGAAALSLTLSRAAVAALLLVGAVVVVRTWRRRRPVAACVGIVLATTLAVGALSGRWWARLDPANTPGPRPLSRIDVWGQAIEAVTSRPLVGVGPGRFGLHSLGLTPADRAAAAHAHQPVLELLATGGLVATAGLALFGAIIVGRAAPGWRRVPAGLSAALAVAILAMVVDNPFLFSSSGNLVALVAGAGYGASRVGAVDGASRAGAGDGASRAGAGDGASRAGAGDGVSP